MRTKATSSILMGAMIAVLGLGLAGCDEAEQGRILRYEKGTYLGKMDTELPAETQGMLRSRASLQRDM